MISSRLRQQGFVNLRRKPLFVLLASLLMSYLYFVQSPWQIPPAWTIPGLVIGILLILTGLMGRVFATLSIGGRKDREIVRTELYSICRNPLYLSSFLIALGVGVLSGRVDFLILAAASMLAIFYPMMINEARFLRSHFEEFADYERTVPLFIPKLRLWQERRKFEVDFRLLKRTFLDASLVIPLIPLILILRNFS
jgi:protein-S-isoprenylcysteine O-methyltransferase Ste14